jgi:UPF0716 protein FxsA
MFAKLALAFVIVPLVELALLVRLGGVIGFWPTVAIVVVTGLAGAALARTAGVQVLLQIRRELRAGRMPVTHMLDGLLVLVGGLVLLTPGLLTDVFGFALLVPWSRRRFRNAVRRRFERMIEAQQLVVFGARPVDDDGPERPTGRAL